MKKFNDQQQKTIENVRSEIQSSVNTSLTNKLNESIPTQKIDDSIKIDIVDDKQEKKEEK